MKPAAEEVSTTDPALFGSITAIARSKQKNRRRCLWPTVRFTSPVEGYRGDLVEVRRL